LIERGIHIVRCASIYETEPHGVKDQPWFLNTAVEIETDLDPLPLLDVCLTIEQDHGRVRDHTGGPRTLDLDIIFHENRIIRLPNLSVPHPRFAIRRFVLVPLAEIAAAFVDPVSGKTIAELLDVTPDATRVDRFAGALQIS
jgi:2-amino-4-hydroxy-6-hydroxymethyldihydropteridine diphosphokinase